MNKHTFFDSLRRQCKPPHCKLSFLLFWALLVCSFLQPIAKAQSVLVKDSASNAKVLDQVTPGVSSDELVSRALTSNAELQAARLNIERARARVIQAGLRPNPTLDLEGQNGVINTKGEHSYSVGLSYPLEIGGKRKHRIELAEAELEAALAEAQERERRLAIEVRTAYVEALAAAREMEITQEVEGLDTHAVQVVERRVKEGDAAPLEANLLRVELDRLRSRRALLNGKLQAALLRLQNLAGLWPNQPLKLTESLSATSLNEPLESLETSLEIALRMRPDLKLARLEEEVSQAGLRLAKAQAFPDVTVFSRYGNTFSTINNTPIGSLSDRDKLVTVGVSIPLNIFNRNQGAKAEATVSITQATRRREFVEQVVRSEVASAFARYLAAKAAIATYQQGVLERSAENVRAMNGAYEVGAFRVTEVLAERRRLFDSQREFTEALAERYRALSDLQAAMGQSVKVLTDKK